MRGKLFYLFTTLMLLLILFQPTVSQAQARFEITPYYGFVLSTNVRAAQGDFVVKDGPDYGISLNIGHEKLPGGMMIQLLYNRQSTDAQIKEYPSGTRRDLWPLTVEYFQIGVVRPIKMGKVRPYGVVGLGASNWTPDTQTWGNEWFFAANFGGGARIAVSKAIGIQLQARAFLPMSFTGGGFWCGAGGCSVGMGSYSFIVQFDFTAGISIALGGKK